MRLIDIHHAKKITDWNKISDGLILKCSQGSEFVDHLFKERQKEARKRNLFIGSYHFAGKGFLDGNGKLYFVAQDPIVEADLYIASADYKKGELLILDWEIEYKDPWDWCKKFLDRVEEKTGFRPWIYTGEYRNIKHGLSAKWIAKYGTNDGQMQVPPRGDWKLWQFTSMGRADGIVGNVDLNYTPLSREELVNHQNEVNIEPPIVAQTGFIKYSQNDPRWKDDFIGGSKWTLAVKGCVVCQVCTLASWFGETITPKELASHKELFTKDGLILWPKLNGILKTLNFLFRGRFFGEQMIDEALRDSNKCVILNVDHGYHFVGGLRKTYLGYTASDPYPYPAKNRNYKNAEISGFALLIKKDV